MSSGKVHDRIALLAAIPTMVIVNHFSDSSYLGGIAGIAEMVGGLYLSPDLDIWSLPTKRWGILRWYWKPYRGMGHRNWLSHSPIIGTVGRLLYLFAPLLVYAIASGNQATFLELLTPYQTQIFFAVVGVEVSALLHLIADYA